MDSVENRVKIPVYTLKALASKEGISYGHMRRIISSMDEAAPKVWKGYRFIRVGEVKTWFAIPDDAPVDFIIE